MTGDLLRRWLLNRLPSDPHGRDVMGLLERHRCRPQWIGGAIYGSKRATGFQQRPDHWLIVAHLDRRGWLLELTIEYVDAP